MFNDATYGGDWDLDLRYRLYVKTGLTTITVKTKPIYASSGNGNWAGYYINGVSGGGAVTYNTNPALGGGAASNTGSGEYYDIRCGQGITSNSVGCQPYFGGTVQTAPLYACGGTDIHSHRFECGSVKRSSLVCVEVRRI